MGEFIWLGEARLLGRSCAIEIRSGAKLLTAGTIDGRKLRRRVLSHAGRSG